jgi:hypothetical protein
VTPAVTAVNSEIEARPIPLWRRGWCRLGVERRRRRNVGGMRERNPRQHRGDSKAPYFHLTLPQLKDANRLTTEREAINSCRILGNGKAGIARAQWRRENKGAFFRHREAGEGDHWSSRSERTVVEGAHDSKLRCWFKKLAAMKLLRTRVEEKRAGLKSACYVDSCVASLPAPPPPPCFAGWSPSPATAVAEEGRCAAALSTFLEDAADGFRGAAFVVKMSYQDVQLTGLDRADYSRKRDHFL